MTVNRFVKALKATPARFARAQRGNVAVMFAIVLPVLLSAIGSAIDYSRAVNARSAMQAAVDATALMISKEAANLTPAEITSKAQAYFNALYNHPEIGGVTFSAAYTANTGTGASVTVNAGGSMSTDFMRLAGFPSMTLNVSSTTKWGNMRYRVALALDNTGSMASADKMNQLKIATKQLIENFNAMASSDDDVYISIVPFSKDVNIGTSFKNANWLKWSGANDSFDNTAGSCSKRIDPVTKANCQSSNGTWTATSKNKWNGCVMDRTQDYDISNAPPSVDVTDSMVWPQQYDSCPTPMLGMTSVKKKKDDLIDKVDDMYPAGNTNQAIGLAWAWLTHTIGAGPFPALPKDNNYVYQDVIILLTDGLNTENRWTKIQNSIDTRESSLCTKIKDGGIKIFAVQVATDGDPQSNMLKNCTSDPNNTNYFSYITQASQMKLKFDNILKELSKLRVAS